MPSRGRAPARLKVVGALLALIGGLSALAALISSGDVSGSVRAWNVGLGGLATACGAGLILNQRWAWPVALLFALALVALGIYLITRPGDIAFPGAFLVALYAVLMPGVAMLATMLTPRSRGWFRQREDPSETGRSPSTHA